MRIEAIKVIFKFDESPKVRAFSSIAAAGKHDLAAQLEVQVSIDKYSAPRSNLVPEHFVVKE
jgi:hypothetical protein